MVVGGGGALSLNMPVLDIAFSILLCLLTHELSHYFAALCFGHRLRFRFAWGRFYVPRFVWTMPKMERWKQRVVALAGFCGEGFVAGALCGAGWPWMALAFAAHLAAYPFYAGDASDFKWM